jgi:hypothetical protein
LSRSAFKPGARLTRQAKRLGQSAGGVGIRHTSTGLELLNSTEAQTGSLSESRLRQASLDALPPQ